MGGDRKDVFFYQVPRPALILCLFVTHVLLSTSLDTLCHHTRCWDLTILTFVAYYYNRSQPRKHTCQMFVKVFTFVGHTSETSLYLSHSNISSHFTVVESDLDALGLPVPHQPTHLCSHAVPKAWPLSKIVKHQSCEENADYL